MPADTLCHRCPGRPYWSPADRARRSPRSPRPVTTRPCPRRTPVADESAGRGRAEWREPNKGQQRGVLPKVAPQVAGFGVSFSTMFRKVATEEDPEKPRPTEPRYHGRHQLNRHPDGLEKCIGCELCAWACP